MRFLAIALAAATLTACASHQVDPPAPRQGTPTAQQIWDDGQQAYLAWNSRRMGWKFTENGVQARKIAGRGVGPRPEADDTVTIHYVGRLITGTEFDSSRRRNQPATFPLPDLIRGWREAVPLMQRGETWELVIPAELAYGARTRPNIPANSTLIFEIELIDFRD